MPEQRPLSPDPLSRAGQHRRPYHAPRANPRGPGIVRSSAPARRGTSLRPTLTRLRATLADRARCPSRRIRPSTELAGSMGHASLPSREARVGRFQPRAPKHSRPSPAERVGVARRRRGCSPPRRAPPTGGGAHRSGGSSTTGCPPRDTRHRRFRRSPRCAWQPIEHPTAKTGRSRHLP